MNLDDYARRCSMLGVTQIVANEGYENASGGTLEILTEILQAYVENIGSRAKYFGEVAGRTEGNLIDIAKVLKELNLSPRQLIEYAYEADMEFLSSIPTFPIPQKSTIKHSYTNDDDNILTHYMPPFPMKHTYSFTERVRTAEDPQTRSERRAREKTQASELIEKFSDKMPSGSTLLSAGPINATPMGVRQPRRLVEPTSSAQTGNMFLMPTTPHALSRAQTPFSVTPTIPSTPKREMDMEVDEKEEEKVEEEEKNELIEPMGSIEKVASEGEAKEVVDNDPVTVETGEESRVEQDK